MTHFKAILTCNKICMLQYIGTHRKRCERARRRKKKNAVKTIASHATLSKREKNNVEFEFFDSDFEIAQKCEFHRLRNVALRRYKRQCSVRNRVNSPRDFSTLRSLIRSFRQLYSTQRHKSQLIHKVFSLKRASERVSAENGSCLRNEKLKQKQ